MASQFRLALAQLNPTVGDLAANAALARAAWTEAKAQGADMIALPEMFLTGYQTQDLVLKGAFLDDVAATLLQLAADCADGPAMGIGAPDRDGTRIYNAWHVLQDGHATAVIRKHHLPNTEVFDERRLYTSAPVSGPYSVGPIRIGSPICEDAWYPDVAETLAETGAEILLVPNGSPHARAKHDLRTNLMVARVVETGLALCYLNLVGGQDDQVFDGGSFVLNPGGRLVVQMPAFETGLQMVDFTLTPDGWQAAPGPLAPVPDLVEADYHAMVMGLRDYVHKSGFAKVLLGLSGGIDSALVAAVAVDALGRERVRGVMLPSEYTSEASLRDARAVADALGIRLESVPIDGAREAVRGALSGLFETSDPGVAGENIQSRLRGLMLMALSNRFGEMLLSTGNKSEVAVGYATIYGDMAGGYNPLKDMYKTRVFETCRWRNATHRAWMEGPAGQVIDPAIIDKPPSAELRPDQKDEDSLPPYPVLDAILQGLIERDASVADLVAQGHDRDMVRRVEGLLYGAEWKRAQSCPGPRLTARALGTDRRYPMVNRWRDRR